MARRLRSSRSQPQDGPPAPIIDIVAPRWLGRLPKMAALRFASPGMIRRGSMRLTPPARSGVGVSCRPQDGCIGWHKISFPGDARRGILTYLPRHGPAWELVADRKPAASAKTRIKPQTTMRLHRLTVSLFCHTTIFMETAEVLHPKPKHLDAFRG
jgi:hypothetical protein